MGTFLTDKYSTLKIVCEIPNRITLYKLYIVLLLTGSRRWKVARLSSSFTSLSELS